MSNPKRYQSVHQKALCKSGGWAFDPAHGTTQRRVPVYSWRVEAEGATDQRYRVGVSDYQGWNQEQEVSRGVCGVGNLHRA